MRRVVITGVSSGIGYSLTKHLLSAGHAVIGIGRTIPQEFEQQKSFHGVSCDLQKLDALPDLFRFLAKQFSDIDTVVCNAGRGRFGSLEEFTFEEMRDLFHLNVLAHMYLCKALVPCMKRRQNGDIIIIGSVAALSGKRKGSLYCASKFALRGFAQALRDECGAAGIRVSAIHPGMVDTPFYDELSFTPGSEEGEALHPDDIVQAIDLILNSERNAVFDEIVLSPRKSVVSFKKDSQPRAAPYPQPLR